MGVVVTDIAFGEKDRRFDYQAGKIGHSIAQRLVTAATFLRSCIALALRHEDEPHDTRYTLGRNTLSIIKI